MAQAPGLALQPAVQVGGAAARLLDAPVGGQHALARDPAELAQAVAFLPAQTDPHGRRVAPRQQPLGDLAPFVVVGERDQVAAVAGAVGGGVGEAQAVGLTPVAVAGVRRREAVAAGRAGEAAVRATVAVDPVAVVALLDLGPDLAVPAAGKPAAGQAAVGGAGVAVVALLARFDLGVAAHRPDAQPALHPGGRRRAAPAQPDRQTHHHDRRGDQIAVRRQRGPRSGWSPSGRSVETLSEVAAASGVRPADAARRAASPGSGPGDLPLPIPP